jgi:menaquinol-cytochrome c reductase iron-sulfur subunit
MNPPEANSSIANTGSTRRSYLGWLIGLCTTGIGAVLSVPLIRFSLYPLRVQTTEVKWSDAGPVSNFASLSVPVQRSITVEQVDGWRKSVAERAVYVVKNTTGHLQVFSAVCPHLGCSVQWRDSKHEFECPCHAAAFGGDGSKLGGPAPRGMDSLETRIENGHLMVRYQYFRQLIPTKEVIG